MAPTVGERLRKARQGQNLSLQQVAEKAHLSSATLSRIETNKQGLDLEVFLSLARILELNPSDLLGGDSRGEGKISVSALLSRLEGRDRLRVWRELTLATKTRRIDGKMRRAQIRAMAGEIQELIAQMEFIRAEIDYLRKRLRNC